jgi:elongation factor Ts
MKTSEVIKKLRETSGAGVMECKRAFDEAGGDFDRALKIISEQGLVKAEKKADRQTSAGLVSSYIHNDRIGVLLEIHCETDFVSRLEDFKSLAREIAMQIAAMEPKDAEELLGQPYIRDESITVGDLVKKAIAKTGENIQVAKFCRYAL